MRAENAKFTYADDSLRTDCLNRQERLDKFLPRSAVQHARSLLLAVVRAAAAAAGGGTNLLCIQPGPHDSHPKITDYFFTHRHTRTHTHTHTPTHTRKRPAT